MHKQLSSKDGLKIMFGWVLLEGQLRSTCSYLKEKREAASDHRRNCSHGNRMKSSNVG
jgi:hypothetical protein